jgi:hypothetical protein
MFCPSKQVEQWWSTCSQLASHVSPRLNQPQLNSRGRHELQPVETASRAKAANQIKRFMATDSVIQVRIRRAGKLYTRIRDVQTHGSMMLLLCYISLGSSARQASFLPPPRGYLL